MQITFMRSKPEEMIPIRFADPRPGNFPGRGARSHREREARREMEAGS